MRRPRHTPKNWGKHCQEMGSTRARCRTPGESGSSRSRTSCRTPSRWSGSGSRRFRHTRRPCRTVNLRCTRREARPCSPSPASTDRSYCRPARSGRSYRLCTPNTPRCSRHRLPRYRSYTRPCSRRASRQTSVLRIYWWSCHKRCRCCCSHFAGCTALRSQWLRTDSLRSLAGQRSCRCRRPRRYKWLSE